MLAAPAASTRDPDYEVLLYYRYFAVGDPEEYAEAQRAFCLELGLKGRIIVASEGLNGTVSGPVEGTRRYREAMGADPRTAEMPFKVEASSGHVFRKLSVKVRPEIVTLGLRPEEEVDPLCKTGERLAPAEFLQRMREPDTVVLDGRNDYETALGRFRGAICPPLENFREFPEWLRANADRLRGKRILTYCTGGIRCEKLSAFLLEEGYGEVAQLDGGIIRYAQDPETQGRDFDGLCYVFDERVGVEVNHTETRRVISRCRHCGVPEPRYANCLLPECNAQIFVCEACRGERGVYCGEACRERHALEI